MPKGVERYGVNWGEPEAGVDPSASIELAMAFHQQYTKASGFLGRYEHLHNAINLFWNLPRRIYAEENKLSHDPRRHDVFITNDWTELMLRDGFCEEQWTTVWGPNASWKTTTAAIYGDAFWMASPMDTIVVVTSTTLDGLRKRIWREMVKFWAVRKPFGNLIQSRNCIQFVKGEDAAGIFGVATGQDEGEVEKAVNRIIGFHARRVLVIVDEMQATNEAIVTACVSLSAGAEEFQFIGLGNPDSELDSLGQMSEPIDGWDSISVESQSWKTKRGICIHLDGLDCPRVKEGDEFYPGMLRQQDIDSTKRDYGEDSPEFWKYRRGFIAPQGVQRTVLSPALITKCKMREKAIWVGEYTVIAALDPSFEGLDRCPLRFYHIGEITDGLIAFAMKELILLKVQVSSAEPIHYQIVRMVKEECVKRNVPSDRFGTDSTGEGGGLASIFVREWGPIHLFEFGGRPSTDPISETNPKRADLEYDRKVTELHFRFRTAGMNGQIRELDQETAREFCQRRYDMKGNLISIETKTIMKQRTRRSPDLSDNAVIGLALARKLGLLGNPKGEHIARGQDKWRDLARKYNNVDSDYLVA